MSKSKSAKNQRTVPIQKALQMAMNAERNGHPDAALSVYRKLAAAKDMTTPFMRDVTAGLYRLGDVEAAQKLNERSIAERAAQMPDKIETALEGLWNHVDKVRLDPDMLDWAWEARPDDLDMDRDEWERHAKWGALADRVLRDWFEVHPDGKGAENLFPDLKDSIATLEGAKTKNGLCVAAAHIGPIFSGPLFWAVADYDCRYVGAFPAVPGSPLAKRLISTSTLTPDQVRDAAREALEAGLTLYNAPDASPRANVESADGHNLPIRIAPLLPRLAFQMGTHSYYTAAKWQGHQIVYDRVRLPDPEEGESEEQFIARWRKAYYAEAMKQARTRPENLRLHRGLWRSAKKPV
ncbi:hypothetical protein [Sphingomicrobium sediminis]|uniref:Tetratricopeptide repeat protein n=1 Tax=Sphingomicrobium sediminis TaxID=2950949 RepID=A0A9X2EIM0_9SPHN|nr:hypothetical protein [Sphingomicrobium sediminis]MCM8557461.1 hypothetical protein [Sphingomicrobium sediminis]